MEATKSTGISQAANSDKPKQRRPRKRRPTQILDRAREKLDELLIDLREYPELSEEVRELREKVISKWVEEANKLPS